MSEIQPAPQDGAPPASPGASRAAVQRGRQFASTATHRLALFVFVVLLWDLTAKGLDSRSVPPVLPVLQAARTTVGSDVFWSALAGTLQSWSLGMLCAASVGIPVGLMIGSSALATRMTRGVVEFMRTVPAIMLVPLTVLVFGATVEMKVFLISLLAVWPLLVHAAYGIRNVDTVALDSAKVFRLPFASRVVFLYLPSAMPVIATGLRVAATVALLISIGSEIVTSAPGIGHEILLSQANNNAARAFVFVLMSGLLGVLINQAFGAVERRTMFWHAAQRVRAALTRGASLSSSKSLSSLSFWWRCGGGCRATARPCTSRRYATSSSPSSRPGTLTAFVKCCSPPFPPSSWVT